MVAVPSAIKVFNWTATLYKGSIWLSTPMLYALGFLGLFLVGGLTGCSWRRWRLTSVHDTYFIVAHFHYIMVNGRARVLGGIHFWWPKITGRMYSEKWGPAGAIIIFMGFN